MQKDTLLALLQEPENLLEDHLEELEEVIQKYPYFHLPHTLIAKLLHSRQSSLASQKIRKASLYVYNRAILKEFILTNPNKFDVEEEFSNQDKPKRNPFADIQQEIDDFDKKLESSSIEDLEKELATITESYLPKDYLNEDVKAQENNDVKEEVVEQTENQKEQNLLIDDFLSNFNKISETSSSELFSALNTLEDSTEEEAIKLFDEGNTKEAIAIYEQLKLKFPEKATYYQSQIDIFSMDFGNIDANTQILEDTNSNLENNVKEDFDTSTLINDFLATPTKSIEEEDNNIQEEKIEEIMVQEEPITLLDEPNQPEIPNAIVEKELAPQEKISTESIESNSVSNTEATEAQAIAFFSEGNVEKAVEIYRQLILQNPDKKAYFVSQIEILES